MSEWFDLGTGIKGKKIGEHEGGGFYLVRLDAGAVMGPERHEQRETGVVLEGTLKVRLGFVDELVDGEDLTGFDVSPGEEHTLTSGPAGALLLVVARPDWPTNPT